MIFQPAQLAGVYVIALHRFEDERGFFARSWSREDFDKQGLNANVVQCNVAYNLKKHTLRGMHFQRRPHAEAKLIRCTRGAIFDVVVDLRPESPTFKQWAGFELDPVQADQLYIPEGFAHGYLTLTDETEVFYQVTEYYHPESAGGVRWNDPAFGIRWPAQPSVILGRDRDYPDFVS